MHLCHAFGFVCLFVCFEAKAKIFLFFNQRHPVVSIRLQVGTSRKEQIALELTMLKSLSREENPVFCNTFCNWVTLFIR